MDSELYEGEDVMMLQILYTYFGGETMDGLAKFAIVWYMVCLFLASILTAYTLWRNW